MAFTTQLFLFIFFPFSMLVFYATHFLQQKGFLSKLFTKIRAADVIIILISFAFYVWAGIGDLVRLVIYIIIVFFLGKVIEKLKDDNVHLLVSSKNGDKKVYFSFLVFALAIVLTLFVLVHFKYVNQVISFWNKLFKDSAREKSIIAPLGVSFITFSAISYLADIYMQKSKAGSIIDCALYISFFPKVVSGPIELWRNFSSQKNRQITLDGTFHGLNRIMIGFIKKVILADTFGSIIASVGAPFDVPSAWLVGISYMLQIYFDFAGYSDIAIGLSLLFGFSLKENFNSPYLSTSISEFWRRWHISLGTWFREYVYFPLGGSKKGKRKTILNLVIVFALTGIWHGANLGYLLWGLINGFCCIIERLIKDRKCYIRTPKIIKWFFTISITFFCWQLFRFGSYSECIKWLGNLFGKQEGVVEYTWRFFYSIKNVLFITIGIIASTLLGLPKIKNLGTRIAKHKIGAIFTQIILLALFIVSITFMVNSKYSPFLYFQY